MDQLTEENEKNVDEVIFILTRPCQKVQIRKYPTELILRTCDNYYAHLPRELACPEPTVTSPLMQCASQSGKLTMTGGGLQESGNFIRKCKFSTKCKDILYLEPSVVHVVQNAYHMKLQCRLPPLICRVLCCLIIACWKSRAKCIGHIPYAPTKRCIFPLLHHLSVWLRIPNETATT